MNSCMVNGVEVQIPVTSDSPLETLLQYLRSNLVSNQTYISSLKVNGAEISEGQERDLAQTPLSQLNSIEIFTVHPREVAETTLQNLIEFSDLLEKYCARIGTNPKSQKFYSDFSKLMDGVETLTEGIAVVKKIFNITPKTIPSLDRLEEDLLVILQNLLKLQEQKKSEDLGGLIREGLRENLQNWRDVALPALINSHSC